MYMVLFWKMHLWHSWKIILYSPKCGKYFDHFKKVYKRVSDYCLVHMNRRHSKKCMTVYQYCFEALTLLTAVVDITVFPSSSFIYGITPRFGRVFGCPAVVLWYKLVWEVCHSVGVAMRLLIIPSLARREVLSHIDTPFVQMWLTVIETIVGWKKAGYNDISLQFIYSIWSK